jgi:PPE-repeat protein
MPNAKFQFVTSVTFLGRDIPLLKPIALFNARRLEALLPQIAALNAARKTKGAAAAALGVTQQTLATWIKLTQTTWLGKVNQPKYRNAERHRANVKAWRLRNMDKVKAMKRAYYLRCKARRFSRPTTHA